MTDENSFVWEFACPKFVDFTDSKVLALNAEEADKYFEREHEFSFTTQNLSDCLKVESLLAKAEIMASPIKTPNRPASASSDYRTPQSTEELESDEVFYTTRKYFLRETECRRLTQTGASPYKIPGGTTASKKKSRRTPFQPKVVEENAKQLEEEELLVKNLAKALFIDNEDTDPSDNIEKPPLENKDNNCDGECDEKASETENKENTQIIISEPSPAKSVVDDFASSTEEEEPNKDSTDEEEARESSGEYATAQDLTEEQKEARESSEQYEEVAVTVAEEKAEFTESVERAERAKESIAKDEVKEIVSAGSDENSPITASAPNRKATKPHWTPTKPVSPKLTACKRKRTLTCVSRQQLEENIAQSIKKNTFKATPFNKKTYLSTVNVGVKRVDPKPTTKPVPFYFHSEERIRARRSKVSTDLFNRLPAKAHTTKKPQKPLLS